MQKSKITIVFNQRESMKNCRIFFGGPDSFIVYGKLKHFSDSLHEYSRISFGRPRFIL